MKKTLLLLSLAVLADVASARVIDVPAQPVSPFADTEVSTNLVIHPSRTDVREEYDTFYASGDNVYAESYGYDSFGNRVVATNALGAVTVSAYDAAASSGGAIYPVRYGYDTEGRCTGLSTTRDEHVMMKMGVLRN